MVTICGRDEKTLNETKAMVLAANGGDEKKLLVVRGDLCDEAVMKKTVEGTIEKFGRLDVLVNNAGSTGTAQWAVPEIEGDISYFDYTLNLNARR
ncbi:Tetrahydrofolate dehydrogenase/cyclohydrolase NAD(P)-binding domain protein [Trichostrongylus colubriformis]|uniref:Tetrahydrofolate dehydrogenase/cyclohydrolase NAD(P)-binding domain protein n=1 Tax=Trichostrongylus colubriformis TaxID=6319 RepID=A0AAN8FFI8_TRICO